MRCVMVAKDFGEHGFIRRRAYWMTGGPIRSIQQEKRDVPTPSPFSRENEIDLFF